MGSPASLGGVVTMCEWPDLKLSEVAVAPSGFVDHVLTCFCGCDLRWRGDSGPMENYTFSSPEVTTLHAQIQKCASGGAFTHVKARTPRPDGNHIPPRTTRVSASVTTAILPMFELHCVCTSYSVCFYA